MDGEIRRSRVALRVISQDEDEKKESRNRNERQQSESDDIEPETFHL